MRGRHSLERKRTSRRRRPPFGAPSGSASCGAGRYGAKDCARLAVNPASDASQDMSRTSATKAAPMRSIPPRLKIIVRAAPHSSSENAYADIPTSVATHTPMTRSNPFQRLFPLVLMRSTPIPTAPLIRLVQKKAIWVGGRHTARAIDHPCASIRPQAMRAPASPVFKVVWSMAVRVPVRYLAGMLA